MDTDLKERCIRAMLRFKKVATVFRQGTDINMTELMVMGHIAENAFCSGIGKHLHISKAAISQTLNALEKKGYVTREIDKTNRRKITVALTPRGMAALKNTKEYADQALGRLISGFGEENTRQLVALLERLSDIADEIRKTPATHHHEGDDKFD